MGVKMEVSPELKRLLATGHKEHVEGVLRKTCYEIGEKINNKIKQEGFAPRDTGKFADEHKVLVKRTTTYIVSFTYAKMGVPLWMYIVDGHKTLTTEKSRRWWFAYLKNVLGGVYTRKTKGKRGYVPPNRYHKRAVKATPVKRILNRMVKDLLKR